MQETDPDLNTMITEMLMANTQKIKEIKDTHKVVEGKLLEVIVLFFYY